MFLLVELDERKLDLQWGFRFYPIKSVYNKFRTTTGYVNVSREREQE